VLDAPVDVVLGVGNEREVVQPDIVFVAAERVAIITTAEIVGCPDLVVEIFSPGTEERDRNDKKRLYARYGAREYWIVDPIKNNLERYVLTDNGFAAPMLAAADATVTSPLFPGLQLDCREIFS
jgi:Uma2 family endonuclease